MFLATRPISFTAHRPPLLFHRRNFRPISRKEHAEKALRLKASPRQQTFLASKRIAELDRNGKIVDAIACVVGHRAVERLSLAGLNTHFSPLTKSATSSSLPKQIPRIAFHRPEAWNTLLAALARRGMVEASWGVYTAMRRQDVQPSPETISCLLESCAHGLQSGSPSNPKDNQHLQRALRLYRWMDASSPSPTITSQHQKSTLPPIQPPKMNRFHINAILKCCSRAGDYSSMIAIYQAMNHVRSPLRATPAVDKDESDHLTEFVREKRREAKDRRRRARNQQQIQDGLILERDSAIVSDTHSDGDWISQRLENFMHDSTNTPDEILQDTETDVVGRSQLIRPDAATYSILLSAFARMGGEDGYTKALQIWKDVSQDAEQSVAIVLKQRELFFKARLEKNRKSSLDSEVLRITKNSKHSVKRTNKCVELSEEEYLEYMTREDARLEADLAFPVVQINPNLVNAMLLVCKNSSNHDYFVRGLQLAQEHFGATCDWQALDAFLQTQGDGHVERLCERLPNLTSKSNNPGLTEFDLTALKPIQRADPKSVLIILDIFEQIHTPAHLMPLLYRFFTDPASRQAESSFFAVGSTVKPDITLESHNLRLLVNAGQYKSVIDYFNDRFLGVRSPIAKKLKGKRENTVIAPPVASFNAALRSCAALHDEKNGVRIWNEMIRFSILSSTLKDTTNAFVPDAWSWYHFAKSQLQNPWHAASALFQVYQAHEEKKKIMEFKVWKQLGQHILASTQATSAAISICDKCLTVLDAKEESSRWDVFDDHHEPSVNTIQVPPTFSITTEQMRNIRRFFSEHRHKNSVDKLEK